MKLQDIVFVTILSSALFLHKPRVCVGLALICFVVAIPLYISWTFFTAQRLVMYGAAFLLVYCLHTLLARSGVKHVK